MGATNSTVISTSEFELICFPGILNWQHLLSVPLTLLLLLTLPANITVVIAIFLSPKLHHPQYFFLCALFLVDLLLSLSISPRTLIILWFHQKTISAAGCFTQTYILYFSQGMESALLLFLAYDRYIAICRPLHYLSIITKKLAAQAIAVVLLFNFILFLPFPFLVAKLQYCVKNTVQHCFCEFLNLVDIACGNTSLYYIYALALASLIGGILTLGLVFSYTMIIHAVLRLASADSALKAFSTCSSHLLVTGIVYCFVIFAAISTRIKEFIPQYVHILLSMLRYLSSPALHPLVYGIRTQDLRVAIKNLFRKS